MHKLRYMQEIPQAMLFEGRYQGEKTSWRPKAAPTECQNKLGEQTASWDMGFACVCTCGTPSQSSACCMASRALSTGFCGSQDSQSGHRPINITQKILLIQLKEKIKGSHVLKLNPPGILIQRRISSKNLSELYILWAKRTTDVSMPGWKLFWDKAETSLSCYFLALK